MKEIQICVPWSALALGSGPLSSIPRKFMEESSRRSMLFIPNDMFVFTSEYAEGGIGSSGLLLYNIYTGVFLRVKRRKHKLLHPLSP